MVENFEITKDLVDKATALQNSGNFNPEEIDGYLSYITLAQQESVVRTRLNVCLQSLPWYFKTSSEICDLSLEESRIQTKMRGIAQRHPKFGFPNLNFIFRKQIDGSLKVE